MVQTTQPRRGNHSCIRSWIPLGRSSVRRVLCQGIVSAIFVVVIDVITHEPEQMSFVQHDHMVQDLSTATPNPSFRDSILPGRLDARPLRFQAGRVQKSDDPGIKFGIAVQNRVTVWTSFRKSLAQLLHAHSALGCRVTLKCRILRRPCSMTKKQYNNWNVNVGTVKKSKATMTSL